MAEKDSIQEGGNGSLPEMISTGEVDGDLSSPEGALPPTALAAPLPVNLDVLFWAIVLIWTGTVLLAGNLGYLDRFAPSVGGVWWNWPFLPEVWRIVLLGAAALAGIEILVRLFVRRYRRNVLGYVVLVIVLVSLGVGRTEIMWPLILVAVGASILTGHR
jgi:hypothetical protein